MSVSRFLFLLLHCGLLAFRWTGVYAEIGSKLAIDCYNEISKENNIAHLLIDVSGPKQIEEFCWKMSDLMKCVADNEHYLTTAEDAAYLKLTHGVTQFFLNICPPGHLTEQYKIHSPCFHVIKNQIIYCGSQLPSLSGHELQKDKNKCCAFKEHGDCMAKAAFAKCGEEAAKLVEQILLKFFQSELRVCEKLSTGDCHWKDTKPDFVTFTRSDHGKEDRKWLEDESKFDAVEPWKGHKCPKEKHHHHHNGALSSSGTSTSLLFVASLFSVFKFWSQTWTQ